MAGDVLSTALFLFGGGLLGAAIGGAYLLRPQVTLRAMHGVPETDDPDWFVHATRTFGVVLGLVGVGAIALAVLVFANP